MVRDWTPETRARIRALSLELADHDQSPEMVLVKLIDRASGSDR